MYCGLGLFTSYSLLERRSITKAMKYAICNSLKRKTHTVKKLSKSETSFAC